MENRKIEISYKYCQKEELDAVCQELIDKAIAATQNSYADYSHFYVGAALLLDNGDVVIGANQENVAFPSGLCAERTAIFAAQAQQPMQAIKAIAIAARNDKGMLESPITPCGACRQVMLEIEERYHSDMEVYLYGTDGVYIVNSVKDLLPFAFVSL
ncbi:cytidine deaminase [Prevotella sp. DNF00663]|uniref:cytidine deaminase n=1 Tax=Prevotella sp. DNF00663 TaxID=1384078 RepID=UPI0007814DA0|nr:cytidine deaminase [Prevotella sp. DNF00663]KXB78435.1 cytidine deaminase [Prevotella sp. DNF00663]